MPNAEAALATAVADLVVGAACEQCLVWSKSDTLIRHMQQAVPQVPTGCIVMGDTMQARAAGMDRPMRLPGVQVKTPADRRDPGRDQHT